MKQDKNIDEFSKYLIKDVELEKPSSNFVSNVINTINTQKSKNTVLAYKPLISKLGWFFIAFCLIGLFTFFYISSAESLIKLPSFNLSFFNKLRAITIFEHIKLSKIFTFSFILFSVLVLFQFYYIKKYFSKNTVI